MHGNVGELQPALHGAGQQSCAFIAGSAHPWTWCVEACQRSNRGAAFKQLVSRCGAVAGVQCGVRVGGLQLPPSSIVVV